MADQFHVIDPAHEVQRRARLTVNDVRLATLKRLVRQFSELQEVVTQFYADHHGTDPPDQVLWDRDDMGVEVAQALDVLLTDGYDIVKVVERTEPAPTELPGPFGTACPCGSTTHTLSTHPTRHRAGFTERIGIYEIDDPIAEHRDGEHDRDPQPECCAACVSAERIGREGFEDHAERGIEES